MALCNRVKVLSALILFLSGGISAVSIIVHGTFAAQDTWYQPGSPFFNAFSVAQQAQELIIPFTWSGDLTHAARVQGAQALAEIVLQYSHEPVTVVGHSHGANVINLASNLLALAKKTIESQQEEICLQHIDAMIHLFVSAPVQYNHSVSCMSYTRAVTQALVDTQKTPQESPDDLRKLLAAAVNSLRDKMQKGSQPLRGSSKKYLIDKAQFLAAPILTDNYAPNMDIIKRVENYYSQEDWIQAFAGNQGHVYPPNPRMIQARVCFCDAPTVRKFFDPDHSGMHDLLVAKWLPRSMQFLEKTFLGKHVVLVLYRNDAPPLIQEMKLRMHENISEADLIEDNMRGKEGGFEVISDKIG